MILDKVTECNTFIFNKKKKKIEFELLRHFHLTKHKLIMIETKFNERL